MAREHQADRSVQRLAQAAAGENPPEALEGVVLEQLHAGMPRPEIYRLCNQARGHCRTEQAEDHLLDLMDRLTGWCPPDDRL